jgi:aspartate/methionine/tyrosine aminotransferase
VLPADGSYFITADFSTLGFDGDDLAFCRTITEQAGVAAIPISAFYAGDAPSHFVRFAFCKQDSVLNEALGRLGAWLTRTQGVAQTLTATA